MTQRDTSVDSRGDNSRGENADSHGPETDAAQAATPAAEPAAVGADTGSGRPSVIIVGYSSKPEGRAALDRAILAAGLTQASVVVVYTSPDEELTAARTELEAAGLSYETRRAPDEHDPADEMIRIADTSASAMIVIGLRRRSPVGKLLLGSNAQRVLLDASCPVLAVKADASAPTPAATS